MQTKDLFYGLVILGLTVISFQKCAEDIENKPIEKMYNVKDTTRVTKYDTISFSDTTKVTTYAKVYIPVYDTLTNTEEYINPIDDSLIGGNIQTTIKDCKMISQKLNYIPKFPKYITKTETITIHDSTYVEKTIKENSKTQLGIGLQVTAPYTMLTPHIYLKTKSNSIFGVGYDVVNKNYSIQFIKILKLKK